MLVTIPEIMGRLQQQKRTCVLTFQLENERHLLKCFFNHGVLCHVSCGEKKNADCLPLLTESRYRKYSFLDDASSHMPATAEQCAGVRGRINAIERVVDGSSGTVYGLSVQAEAVEPGVIERVESRLGDIVGPVASILLDGCLQRLGCTRGDRLSRAALLLIVQCVARELPERERAGFIANCRM